MAKPILELRGFGVAFGDQVVLAEVDLALDPVGSTVLVGPVGTGKSTLVRTLVGLNDAQPALRIWGTVRIGGAIAPMAKQRREQLTAGSARGRRIALVMQDARLLTATVFENLASGLRNRSALTRSEQIQILTRLLRQAGLVQLENSLDTDVVSLPMAEQRMLSIVRSLAADPPILFVDEGTAELDENDSERVIALLRREASRRAIVFVTHNQAHARALGGTTVLLAGGRIVARDKTERFFSDPEPGPAADFVRTGGCRLPSPAANHEDLAETIPPPPPLPAAAKRTANHSASPRGFYWLEPNRIAGLPRPGIVADLRDDLEALRRLDVSVLITLEETVTLDPAVLREFGIAPHFCPIDDMKAPSLHSAANLCSHVERLVAAGRVVALHCRAGLGRTGTALACIRIWRGDTALRALDLVRGVNPWFIQSAEQVAFLSTFENWTRKAGPGAPSKVSSDDQTQTNQQEKQSCH